MKRTPVGNIGLKATDNSACDSYLFYLQMMVSTYKIYRIVVEFHMESNFTHLTRKCLRGRPFKSYWRRCCSRRSKYAVNNWGVPFWNKPPAEIPRLSPSRHSWTPSGGPCSLTYPYNAPPLTQPIPSAHIDPL